MKRTSPGPRTTRRTNLWPRRWRATTKEDKPCAEDKGNNPWAKDDEEEKDNLWAEENENDPVMMRRRMSRPPRRRTTHPPG